MISLNLNELREHFQKNSASILADFFEFLKFPSIATDPAHREDTLACADWLQKYLKTSGLQVKKWQTSGAPTLFASFDVPQAGKPTLLLYSHYDVQPVDPLSLWQTPPFAPDFRDGNVYARGALDDKGQTFYTLIALKTLLEKTGTLPCNIKWIIEGEEESGSEGLRALLTQIKSEIDADYIVIVDSSLGDQGEPAITLGARGIATMTVTLKGSSTDLHSGTHGGIVYNPNRALVELLASLHDANGKVTIPGFYDDVVELPADEKKQLCFDFDQSSFERSFEAKAIGMEKGYQPLESAWLRPTLEINGISGGYAGAGFKTVIPAMAMAKISCRLVPNQSAEKIGQLVKNHLEKHSPKGLIIEIELHAGGHPFRTTTHSHLAHSFSKAYEEVFERRSAHILLGGSIPIAADIQECVNTDMLLMGMGLATDRVHAPNEHFGWDRFEKGYLVMIRALMHLGK